MSEIQIYGEMSVLYDAAFAWDNAAEVAFLERELTPRRRRVLEPGCGSGRLLVPMAARGFEMVGIDASPQMLALTDGKLAEVRAYFSVESVAVHAEVSRSVA